MSRRDVSVYAEETLSPNLFDAGLMMKINGLSGKINAQRAEADMSPFTSGTVDVRPSFVGTVFGALENFWGMPSRSGWAMIPVRTGDHWRLLLVHHGDGDGPCDGYVLFLLLFRRPDLVV